ncbi:hypothetical protein HOI83_00940 [Candidatus Uhrbacteria bacterium]|nr:hypothetical protein [Candidatus Uhrbacteria bacterium]
MRDFQSQRTASDNDEYELGDYAISILKKNLGRYLRPRSCKLGNLSEVIADCTAANAAFRMHEAGEQMTDTDMLAAHREEQPALGRLQHYLCRGCNVSECPILPPSRRSHQDQRSGLAGLMQGLYPDRCKHGKAYLLELLPQEIRDQLEAAGVKVHATQLPSRKQPSAHFCFKRGDEEFRVDAAVGKRGFIHVSGPPKTAGGEHEFSKSEFNEVAFRQHLQDTITSLLAVE